MYKMKVSQMAIVGTEHSHGRDSDAVLEGKTSDSKRGEEGRADFVFYERCAGRWRRLRVQRNRLLKRHVDGQVVWLGWRFSVSFEVVRFEADDPCDGGRGDIYTQN